MKKILLLLFLFSWSITVLGQKMDVLVHPNTGLMALLKNEHRVSEFIFSEISEFSEYKAYAAQGDLYAYIDTNGNALTPFMFTIANNFVNGYAIIGDSFSLGLINAKMQWVVPQRFNRVLQPKLGLVVLQSQQGYWGAYDMRGYQKLPFVYDLPPVYDHLEYIVVRKDLAYGVVNDCNEVKYNTAYQYINKSGMAYRSGHALRLFHLP